MVLDMNAAISNFTRYIEHEDQLRYDMRLGPLEFKRPFPIAPRRGEIEETLYWDAEEGCWYSADKKKIVLREDIWKTIASVINQLGGDTRPHYVYNAVREKFHYISQKDVREACKQWRKNNLSLLDSHNGTTINDNASASMSEVQGNVDLAAKEAGRRATRPSTPTPNRVNPHKNKYSGISKSVSRGRGSGRRSESRGNTQYPSHRHAKFR